MKQVKVKKGEILQTAGDLNTKIYEVKSGLLRSYTIDTKGKEYIIMFAPEDWMMADVGLPYEPCQLFISAIEDSEVVIYEKDSSVALFEKQKLRNCLEEMQTRIIMLMSKPAIQRYEHFVQTYPEIVRRVPQKMIASYLGITPEGLSKVKSERRRQV
ncbi:MAG: Crp/Fnr family transcriptional regulator [Saprospiraceae bacterium]|nr:Crp/Fnr family transcriptional regulator [Saprospiraceae bacterium]